METTFFDLHSLIKFCIKFKKPLIIIGLISLILSSVISLFIEDKYESSVIMFPTSTNSISKALLSENPGKSQDILQFGEDEQVEQLLQILNSDEIKERIIGKYKLMSHYNIDSTERYKFTELYKQYNNNISASRTEFMSVQVIVFDKDPKIACQIANDIASLVDTVSTNIQRQRAVEAYKIVQRECTDLQKYIHVMEDSLKILGRLGIHDYKSQSKELSKEYAHAVAKGEGTAVKALEEKLKILTNYGGNYISITKMLILDRKRLELLKEKYTEAKIDAESVIPHKFIVNKATEAEKKTYPIRWLIVLVSTISTLIFAIIVLSVINKQK